MEYCIKLIFSSYLSPQYLYKRQMYNDESKWYYDSSFEQKWVNFERFQRYLTYLEKQVALDEKDRKFFLRGLKKVEVYSRPEVKVRKIA